MIIMAPATRREALGVEVDYSLPAQRVIRLLDRLISGFGKPERLRSDRAADRNGPEFISGALLDWCTANRVMLHRIDPYEVALRSSPSGAAAMDGSILGEG